MKKSKFLKRASVIGLSAVMTAGVALAAAACGGNGGGGGVNSEGYKTGTPGASTDPNKLTVHIFCAATDAATNEAICKDYMAKYNEANNTGGKYSVDFTYNTDKKKYFDELSDKWSTDDMYDVIYLAPRYVRSYAETGSVLNLADYLDTVSADPAKKGDEAKAANQAVLGEIWANALSYYAYKRSENGELTYTRGQSVHYDKAQNGFYTDAGNEEVGLYGLPKDYSNFSTGYNGLFFTDAIKQDITTKLATTTRTVKGGSNETSGSKTSGLTFSGNSGYKTSGLAAKSVIQYAVDVTNYDNPYTDTKETISAKAGDAAPIINVGIPTRYYPFNFYRYASYTEALAGGDPLACLCEAFTDYDNDGTADGYIVTLPGFPNDEIKVPAGAAYQDANAPYDTSIAHVTYTYAEYAAFIWAMTYYLNTFDWQHGDGLGGVKYADSEKNMVVFGGEQFEGKSDATVGAVLYLLPWLYGNDADLINSQNALCSVRELVNETTSKAVGDGANITDPAKWADYVGKATEKVRKMNLDGTYREVDVQYGFNSESFIETYGAFLALASDWNGNNGGDSDNVNSNANGWSYFRTGRSLFYGAGSWDGGTRNDTKLDKLEFGQTTTPVSEDYALYSKIKGANYEMEEYSNGATSKGTGNAAANDKVQRAKLSDGLRQYSYDEVIANQMLRQDKWGARMDSVGYAVNGQVSNYTGDQAWKKEAAIGIAMALTIDPNAQATLTYAGAQFPNFRYQMEEFVNYQDEEYRTTGSFREMLTPEGFADTTDPAEGRKIWDSYYQVALELEAAVNNSAVNGQTVAAFLGGKKDVNGNAIKFDPTYGSRLVKDLAGSTTTAYLAFAMKILRMVPMTRLTREINMRMQYGLNAVRDSTMYTYTDDWVSYVDARGTAESTNIAYTRGQQLKVGGTAINGSNLDVFRKGVKTNPAQSGQMWETPLVFVLRRVQLAQNSLTESVVSERSALDKLQQKK